MTLLMDGLALDDPLRTHVEDKLPAALRGRRRPPTALRVGFTDENGPKGGVDIRCAITVDLPRRPPMHAEGVAETRRLAFDAALDTLARELKRDRERRRDAARRPKKYFAARRKLAADEAPATPPARARRRSA
jgi:putative sigma-54 modulation protein